VPTYAYRCADCGHAFDIHQAFTDDALTVCPECGGTLRKVFGSVGVTFKGSGFYRTDSRGSTTSGAKASEPKAGAAASGSTSSTGSSSSSSNSGGSSSAATSGSSSKAASD
jgi:putative FmdB family regulatory protein